MKTVLGLLLPLLACIATQTPSNSFAAGGGRQAAGFSDLAELVGTYRGTSTPNSDSATCVVKISWTWYGVLKVAIHRAEGIRVFDKDAPGKERIVGSVSQTINPLPAPDIQGERNDTRVWQDKTHLNLTTENWMAHFKRNDSDALEKVELTYRWNVSFMGFGPRIMYGASCFNLQQVK